MTDRAASPNRLPWPPMILAGTIVGAIIAQALLPLMPGLPRPAGWVIAAAGLALDGWAIATLRRARPRPARPRGRTARRDRAFRLSRNPIYVGNTLLLTGLAIAFDNGWLLAGAVIAAVLVHQLAIRREEAHLAARFGASWTDYASRVPRWIGIRGSRRSSA